jgi:ribosomal protein S18 acetylase RimI-like enzyme
MMHLPDNVPKGITIRTSLRPGDLGSIVSLHGIVYTRERGFDATFEAYVAGLLSEFVQRGSLRERLWIAERGSQIVGCVAIVTASLHTAQLRWFLVEPTARGNSLGKRLLAKAVTFSQESGYAEIILWTESALTVAAHLYQAAGFRKVEEKPGRQWGVELVEEKYVLKLL